VSSVCSVSQVLTTDTQKTRNKYRKKETTKHSKQEIQMEDFYCEEVLSGKTSVEKVFETDNVLAYHHTRPFWETHIVVIPKVHVDSLLTVENEMLIKLLDV